MLTIKTNKICRLCTSTDSLCDIFKGEQDPSPYLMANLLLGTQINTNDYPDLPCFVCQLCNQTLQSFYNFKLKCLEVEIKLKKQVDFKKKEIVATGISDSIKTIYPQKNRYEEPEIELSSVYKGCDLRSESFDIKSEAYYDTDIETETFDNDIKTETFDLQADISTIETKPINVKIKLPKGIKLAKKHKYNKSLFQCDLCGNLYKSEKLLHTHTSITHEGIKKYSCSICSKKFTRLEQQKIHSRSHLGIKPFSCDICGKSSTKKQDLIRHMKVHSEEKKHSCPICNKKFKRAGGVTSHLRSHTGERPYPCKYCGKAYKSSNALRKHNIMHHKQ